jgi:hypothetical protein
MTGTLKTTLIQNPSSTDVNITLGTAGQVTLAKSPVLNGSTSGTLTIAAPAVAGTNTITFPAATDTVATLAATQTLTNKTIQGGAITSATAQASTSGSNVDFSIPSYVKRITVMLTGVSTNGANIYSIQLGTGATPTFVATGYTSPLVTFTSTSVGTTLYTTSFGIYNPSTAAAVVSGTYIISNITGNTWAIFGSGGEATVARAGLVSSSLALGAALTAIRVTTVDTFDAGSINIMYE